MNATALKDAIARCDQWQIRLDDARAGYNVNRSAENGTRVSDAQRGVADAKANLEAKQEAASQ